MNFILIAKSPCAHLVLVRDLETGDLLGLGPEAMVLLKNGSGELAKAGQCLPGERGWVSAGRLVVILRRTLRGGA